MSVGLAWKSAAKSNEKLVNQKYAPLFLSWMPFNSFGKAYDFWSVTKIELRFEWQNWNSELALSLKYLLKAVQDKNSSA